MKFMDSQLFSGKIAGKKSPGDSGNCPGVWPHLHERSDVTNASPCPRLGVA